MINHITHKNITNLDDGTEIRYYPYYKTLPERSIEYGKLVRWKKVFSGRGYFCRLKLDFGNRKAWVSSKYCSFVEEVEEVKP